MADYTEEQQLAYDMLSEYGEPFDFLLTQSTATDPNKPWDVSDTTPVAVQSPAVSFYLDGGRTIFISGKNVEITDDMLIRDPQGQMWAFIKGSLQPLDPAGTGQTILYQARVLSWPT